MLELEQDFQLLKPIGHPADSNLSCMNKNNSTCEKMPFLST